MKITIQTRDSLKAERLLKVDEVFSLLWEVNERIRRFYKYEDGQVTGETSDTVLKEIERAIQENNLLNLYN